MSKQSNFGPNNDAALATASSGALPPNVTTSLGYTFLDSAIDGYVTAQFQGHDPEVKGQLSLAIGKTAYEIAGAVPQLSALSHVEAATPVVDASSLIDLSFSTPGQSFALGGETASHTDIAISGSTAGLSGILAPLSQALAGTTLGQELAPIVSFGRGLLPTLDQHGGIPHGGTLGAAPIFAVGAGLGLSQSTTILGHTTTSSQSGSLVLGPKAASQVAAVAGDLANLLSNTGSVVGDVQAGNLLAAVPQGVAALASASTLSLALTPLLADATQHGGASLPQVDKPALDLNLSTALGQTFALGNTDPASTSETLGVHITADSFGAYALGKLLAQIAPQLIKDYTDQGTVQQPLDILSQLATGVSTLAADAAQGFTGLGTAGAIPSSTAHPDISLQLTLGITEKQNALLGAVSNTQTLGLDLQTNAQGFYDLGTAAQPALTDLLLGLLETQAGHEVLQIGGQILGQIDQKLGGSAASTASIGSSHEMLTPHFWHAA